MKTKYVDTRRMAGILGVSYSTIVKWCYQYEDIPFVWQGMPGSKRLFRPDLMRVWYDAKRSRATEKGDAANEM